MDNVHPYKWLERFWDDEIGVRRGRRWRVFTLIDGDLQLRDGLAHALLRAHLRGRNDVDYHFVRAWTDDYSEPIPADADFLFVGRPKPYALSSISDLAMTLDGSAAIGYFMDPNDGRLGSSVRYGDDHVFSRRALDERFQTNMWRRLDRDYGILMHRTVEVDKEIRSINAFGGLGSLATLCLTVIMLHPHLLKGLVEQVRALMSATPRAHPVQHMEICVRINIPGEPKLKTLLNDLELFWAGSADCPFAYQAVLIAFGNRTDLDFCVYTPQGVELSLRPRDAGRAGGDVWVDDGGPSVPFSGSRFRLFRQIVEHPDEATITGLCRALDFSVASSTKGDATMNRRLAKLVHDLNQQLLRDVLAGRMSESPVRYNKKHQRYQLYGVSARVRPATAA